MFDISAVQLDWKGLELKLETGLMARQADGSVLATLGKTSVLCTVVAAKDSDPSLDFFPLSVHYIEKGYSAGKIPGGFFKREGRPSEIEILNSRLIDRPIRPLFHNDFKNETQIICTVIDYDGESDPAICSIIGASAALTLSGLPFLGPIASARVGYIEGDYVLNPTNEELKHSQLDLAVAGTRDGVLMVESEATELKEEIMLGAVQFGYEQFQPVIHKIIELAEKCAKESWKVDKAEELKFIKELKSESVKMLTPLYDIKQKKTRNDSLSEARKKIISKFETTNEDETQQIKNEIKNIEKEIVRTAILKTSKRIDGRGLDDVRQIDTRVNILNNVHGSALFTRGETQALVSTTLGTTSDEQLLDTLDGDMKEKFMLHYNFPPFSVGEAGRIGSTGRREVGHGKLAWRAINPILRKADNFPYTIRVVSEITESNGSSSMATVCGTSLSLMDAGVPLEKPIAGIAMGLIKEGKDFVVLTDILGDEDHLGDMDFKVAGTDSGITSLQMDIKVNGITKDIMDEALSKALKARKHILEEMNKTISKSRKETKPNAPQIQKIKIDKSKIREVIGSGGKVIKDICEKSSAKVEIDDDGNVTIFSSKSSEGKIAKEMIDEIVAEPEVGKIYEGKVVKTTDFGAFVNFLGSKDGLVHISQLKEERVEKTTDVVKEGDQVKVKVIGVDDRGKVKLSIKDV